MRSLISRCVHAACRTAIPTLFLAAAGCAAAPQAMPVATLNAGMHLIHAEVAATEAQRSQGLMHRKELGPNQGMVFVFGAPAQVCMWMKNTPLPLSVAFLDREGAILNIEDMQPHTTTSHCSRQPAHYALEMEQGWFRKKGIAAGTRIRGLP